MLYYQITSSVYKFSFQNTDNRQMAGAVYLSKLLSSFVTLECVPLLKSREALLSQTELKSEVLHC